MGSQGDEIIRKWLAEPESHRTLRMIAENVDGWLRRHRIRPATIDRQEMAGPERVGEILSELEIFLLERGGEFQSLILSGADHIEKYLERAFCNHLLDRCRSLQTDPWRFFYRASSEILRAAKGVHHQLRSGRFFMFSMKIPSLTRPPLREEEIERIAYPPSGPLQIDELLPAKSLLPVAVHFWREACALRGEDLWLDLRDFVNWVFRHITAPKEVALPEGYEPSASARRASRPDTTTEPVSEETILPAEIMRLATCFVNRLLPEEREVFYQRMFAGLDWTEIAARTGHSGPSGPLYRYRRGETKLKRFLRDQERLGPEDFDALEWDFFCEALRRVLKSDVSPP
ncbi:MAG: hypothetical protein WHT06_12290 [Desulfobacterales bacterium]